MIVLMMGEVYISTLSNRKNPARRAGFGGASELLHEMAPGGAEGQELVRQLQGVRGRSRCSGMGAASAYVVSSRMSRKTKLGFHCV